MNYPRKIRYSRRVAWVEIPEEFFGCFAVFRIFLTVKSNDR